MKKRVRATPEELLTATAIAARELRSEGANVVTLDLRGLPDDEARRRYAQAADFDGTAFVIMSEDQERRLQPSGPVLRSGGTRRNPRRRQKVRRKR